MGWVIRGFKNYEKTLFFNCLKIRVISNQIVDTGSARTAEEPGETIMEAGMKKKLSGVNKSHFGRSGAMTAH